MKRTYLKLNNSLFSFLPFLTLPIAIEENLLALLVVGAVGFGGCIWLISIGMKIHGRIMAWRYRGIGFIGYPKPHSSNQSIKANKQSKPLSDFFLVILMGVAIGLLFMLYQRDFAPVTNGNTKAPTPTTSRVNSLSVISLPVQTPPPKTDKVEKEEPKYVAEPPASSLNQELQSDVTYEVVEYASSQEEDTPQLSSTAGASLAYYLQVASFSNSDLAYQAAKNLKATYPEFVYVGALDGKYRVLIGRFDSSWETKQFRKESNFPENCYPVHEAAMMSLEWLG